MRTGKDRQEPDTDRGVSPVISVVLTVAIVMILAATVGSFVLELGGSTSDETPAVSLSVDQQDERLLITHTAGDTINTSNVELTGVKGWGPSEQEFGAGDRISGTPEPGAERVDIVWETTESSSTLRTVDVSNIDVSSLVVNDGFERGSGDEADGWEQSDTAAGANRTDEESLSGDYSIRQGDLTGSYAREILSEPVDVSPDEDYSFGASYYLSGKSNLKSDDDYFVQIIWLDSSGSEIEKQPHQGDPFKNTNKWIEASYTKEAPSSAATAKLEIRAREHDDDDADVYWDETFIEMVG